MSIDRSKGRIGLSLKQMQPDPLEQNLDSMLQPTDSDSEVRFCSCPRLLGTEGTRPVHLPCWCSQPRTLHKKERSLRKAELASALS